MATHPILRQLELALARSGGSERIFRLECAEVIAEYDRRNAQIESYAKVIAALRGALEKCHRLSGRQHMHGEITDYAEIFLTAKHALGDNEQTAGETK
jgi:hypothetical protein